MLVAVWCMARCCRQGVAKKKNNKKIIKTVMSLSNTVSMRFDWPPKRGKSVGPAIDIVYPC